LSGRHFVLCQDISDVYGKDCQIPEDEIPEGVELKCGDRISFEADEPDEGIERCPLARNIKLLTKRTNAAGDGDDEDEDDEEHIEVDEEEDDEKPKKKAKPAVDKNAMDEDEEAGRQEAGDAAVAEGDVTTKMTPIGSLRLSMAGLRHNTYYSQVCRSCRRVGSACDPKAKA